MIDSDGVIAYKGVDTQTLVTGLAPGRTYRVQVRSSNKVGWGEWSPECEFVSGAGCPDAPQAPLVTSRASNCVQISWNEPNSNGAPITEYRLEWALKLDSTIEQFTHLYTGASARHELKSSQFLPSTRYVFRVQALNVNGSSSLSATSEFLTPAAVPALVTSIRVEQVTSELIRVSWKHPQANGSPILFYNLDFGEASSSVVASSSASTNVGSGGLIQVSAHGTLEQQLQQHHVEYTIEMLQPDTAYKLRIQAANSVGVGPFSNIIKVIAKKII